MRKSRTQTDQGLNIFSSSEWPSAPINAVPRVAMLVHYSSLLVVSKGLKCSSHQMWLNLHFRLKPIWISLLLVNYEKKERKEDPRGPKWTQVSFSSIAWIASIRVSHLLDQGAARLTKLAVPVVCLETASTQKQRYWGAFPQVEPVTAHEQWGCGNWWGSFFDWTKISLKVIKGTTSNWKHVFDRWL